MRYRVPLNCPERQHEPGKHRQESAGLNTMCQRCSRQVRVDESNSSSNSLESEPEHQVLGAIGSVNGDHLARLDTQILDEPIANPV